MLYTLCSHLHTEVSDMPCKVSDTFIEENQVVAVLSGGTEAQFLDLLKEKKLDLKRPIYLLVSEFSNSLISPSLRYKLFAALGAFSSGDTNCFNVNSPSQTISPVSIPLRNCPRS